MRSVYLVSFLLIVVSSMVGCQAETPSEEAQEPSQSAAQMEEEQTAVAEIAPKSGSTLTGRAVFTESNGEIQLEVTIENAEPGPHAVHIHEIGDCSAEDASSAGGHWNPTGEDHGKWGVPPFHLGDIGNIEVGEDGTGTLTMSTDRWSLGGGPETDVVGKALVVHSGADDFTSQPSGAAGDRIGCGVIQLQ